MVTATSTMVSGFARQCRAALPVMLTWVGAWKGKGVGRCMQQGREMKGAYTEAHLEVQDGSVACRSMPSGQHAG